jgi:hypothetical protein
MVLGRAGRVAVDGAGVGLASRAVVVMFAGRRGDRHGTRDRGRPLTAWFAEGAIGAAHRRRLAVLGDHEHGELGARR